jgi:hypothetical protein
MSERKYLIYLDILGFEKLAEEISSSKGINDRDVRRKFIDVINDRVQILKAKSRIVGKKYSKSDDWILVTDSIDKVFNCIHVILNHNTGYDGYEKIPLEIAVGSGDYDEWAKFDGSNLVLEKNTIQFLKTRIIDYFRGWYRERYPNQSLRSTFIVVTSSVYDELEPFDKRICEKVGSQYKRDGNKENLTTFFLADLDKVKQRGKMFDFLEKIGYSGNKFYKRVDEVYVPPSEYEEIAKTLRENRIVFITGTREYGKTFTAVRFMWEYYLNGYEPRWIKGGELTERVKVREALENVASELKPRHILYLEDPFGTIVYEKRETLEREIGIIVDSIKDVKDAYVIVTSREEVFKEFEKEKLSAKELNRIRVMLNIKELSYDEEKREQIILNWAEEENCVWLRITRLRHLVLNRMSDLCVLPTPLSMRSFAVNSNEVRAADLLEQKLREQSGETAKAFADEINNMTEDKRVFLAILLIARNLRLKVAKKIYAKLVEELGLRLAWRIDRILDWFKWDKVDIIKEYDDIHLALSHPSYYEALDYLLSDRKYMTQINEKIFNESLLRLSEESAVSRNVAMFLEGSFDKLAERVRNKLLLNLSEREGTVRYVVKVLETHFDEIPREVSNKSLFTLSEKDDGVSHTAEYVTKNFNKLPTRVRNELLSKLSQRKGAVRCVVYFVVTNYYRLPERVRHLLLKLSERKEAAQHVAEAVTANYQKLPKWLRHELLLKLSETEGGALYVAACVKDNFGLLPLGLREELLLRLSDSRRAVHYVALTLVINYGALSEEGRRLLFKLCEQEETAQYVAEDVELYFTRLPMEINTELLQKLSDRQSAVRCVAQTVATNYRRFPEEARHLLFKLCEKEEAANDLAEVVAVCFRRLPVRVSSELLLRLSEREKASQYVGLTLLANFDIVPQQSRNELLLKLSEKERTVSYAANIVAAYFNKLSEGIRNELLLKLSGKDGAVRYVVEAVAANYDKLPEKVRHLLFELSDREKAMEHIVKAVAANYGKLPEEVRHLLFKLCEKKGADRYVAAYIKDNFDEFPEGVRNELLLKLSEREGAVPYVVEAVAANYDKVPEELRCLLFKLSEDERTKIEVVRAVRTRRRGIPENVIKELLRGYCEYEPLIFVPG